jgi:hypothetical protein
MELRTGIKNKNLFRHNTLVTIEAIVAIVALFLLIYLFFPQPS